LVNTNKHNDLYNYANSLTYNCSQQPSREIKQELFVDLLNDIQYESTAENVKLDLKKEVEEESHMEFLHQEKLRKDYEIFCLEEHEKEPVIKEHELEPQLQSETNKAPSCVLSK
ncbi:unnamed protein product, partial [Rotaria socialis]